MSEFAQFVSYGTAEQRERELARKKKRYKTDSEHREAKKAAARDRYEPVAEPQKPQRGRNKPKPWVHEGEVILLVGLGVLADLCGVSKAALRRYEKAGVIPPNRIKDGRGRRWYPKPFAEFLGGILKGQSKRRESLRVLKTRVEQAWTIARRSQGMPVLKETAADAAD